MQKYASKFRVVALAAVIGSILGAVTGRAQAPREPNAPDQRTEEALRRFLQTMSEDKATRYMVGYFDLNADGKSEAIVRLIGNEWCGSGGCNTLILQRTASSWRVVTNITITQLPIRVLAETSHGWHKIGVWVEGGGIEPGYEAELQFDGKTYPRNPSTPPSRRTAKKAEGEVVLGTSMKEVPLFSPSDNRPAIASGDSQGARPSFKCLDAKSSTEKLVCRDSELARMDSDMAAAYRTALQKLNSEQAIGLRREQSEWFRRYARACNSAASDTERRTCIVEYLGSRVQQLTAAAQHRE